MSDAAAYLAAAVLLGFAGYRIATDRRSAPYPYRLSMHGFVLCEGVAMALLAPASADLLTRLGVGPLGVVLAGEVVRTAAISFLMIVAYSLAPHPARVPGFVVPAALLVQAAMTATFLGARPTMTADSTLEVSGAGRWLISGHDALFALYAVWCLVVVIAALGREARRAEPGPLRLGLRLTLAAAGVAVLWSAWTADDIVDVLRSGAQDGSEDVLSNVLGAVCATLVVAGTTVTKWGEAMAAPARWLRTYRAYRRLGPLWEALRAELPQIALADRRRGLGAALPSSFEFALYRRVIEIDDGRLALRSYAHPPAAIARAVRAVAPGDLDALEADARDALLEAVSLAAALANLRAGRKPEDPDVCEPSPGAGSSADLDPVPAAGSVDAEAAWLLHVAEAFTRSPALPRALGRLADS